MLLGMPDLRDSGGMQMEKLKPNVVALSLGITAVVLYAICLVLVAIFPTRMFVPFTNSLIHGFDFSGMMTKGITFSGSMIGII